MTYITVADVRRASGDIEELVSDSQIEDIITQVEGKLEHVLNTVFSPRLRIDVLDGNGTNTILTKKNPVIALRKLTTADTEMTLSGVDLYSAGGKLVLNSGAEKSAFRIYNKDVSIKYYHGSVFPGSTQTTTSAATTAGTSVSVTVASSSSFSADDWVQIVGTDNNLENAKIESVDDATTITVDQLNLAHESGSLVTLLELNEDIKRLMELHATWGVGMSAIGQTYTFNTSYSLGALSVNKGEPYPQWSRVMQLVKQEIDRLMKTVRPRISMG